MVDTNHIPNLHSINQQKAFLMYVLWLRAMKMTIKLGNCILNTLHIYNS